VKPRLQGRVSQNPVPQRRHNGDLNKARLTAAILGTVHYFMAARSDVHRAPNKSDFGAIRAAFLRGDQVKLASGEVCAISLTLKKFRYGTAFVKTN
jgi:hypothetical protein